MLVEEQQPGFRHADSDMEHLAAQKKRRYLRRQLNVPLLLCSIAAFLILTIAGKYWHDHRKLQLADVFLQRAEKLESEEKWSQAITYLQRYLWINPEDLDKRLQMIDVYEKGVKTKRDRSRLSSMFYETLGIAPERMDLRLRLAENLLILGDFVRAEEQAEQVKEAAEHDSTQHAEAKRIIALSLYPRARDFVGASQSRKGSKKGNSSGESWARQAEGVSVAVAAKALADSLEDFPANIELASKTANFYREHYRVLSDDSLDPIKYADGVMDRLLKKKGDDPDALVEIYLYSKRNRLSDSEKHLGKALTVEPSHHRALLFSAISAANQAKTPQDSLDAAEEKLQRAIEVQPGDPQSYVILARLLARTGDLEKSIVTLRDGKQRVGASDFAIGQELVSRLLEAKRIDEAEESLGELKLALKPRLLQLTSASRREVENQLRILQSKLAIQKGDLRSALVELKAIAAATEQESSATITPSGMESRRLLGILTEKLGYWDLAASYWSSLTVDAPRLGEAHYRAGIACLQIRQPGKAVSYLDRYVKPEDTTYWTPKDEGWLALMQAHLQLQMRRSSFSQNWAEFLSTLKEVKQRLPGRWESLFAEADYLNAKATPESREQAYQHLKASEGKYDKNALFWRSLVQAYSSLKRPEDAERALRKFEELEADPLKQGIMRANLFARNEQYEGADKVFKGLLPGANKENKQKIQIQRLRVQLAAKQMDKAKSLLMELIADQPEDPQLLTVGIETMLKAGDLTVAQQWEKQLQSLDLPDEFLWRYFRARRYLANYKNLSKDERNELGQLISSIRSSRPGWYNVIGLAARYAELRGDSRQAIDNYELAIKLGDDSTEMLRRLVLLLNKQGRFSDADAYLNRLSTKQSGTLQVESLEISSAIRNNQLTEAVELARLAVDRHPDDPQRRIWLASLLSLDDQSEAAESVYKEALTQFPKDIRLWNGLFTLLVKSQQSEKAADVLEKLVSTAEAEPVKQRFALAQGYLQLANRERAIEECESALQADPNHVASRLLYAKLLLSTDTPNAEKQLQEVLKRDQNNGEAKLQLASIWAASGLPDDSNRAMQMVESIQSASDLENQASNRLRAQLLSRRGRSQQERQDNLAAARRIIEEQIERSNPPVDVDRLLLAKIYEAEAFLGGNLSALQASREQWRQLIDRPDPVVQYQLQYLEFLFRQLSRPQEDSVRLAEWKKIEDVFLAEAEARVGDLEDTLSEKSTSKSALQLIGHRVRLLKVQDKLEDARQLLDKYVDETLPEVEEKTGKARAYLGIGNLYASIKEHEQAAEWYRKLSEIAPQTYILLVRELAAQGQLNEAIDVCLAAQDKVEDSSTNVAAVLAQLMSTAEKGSEAEERVQPIIDAALKSHQDDVDLLLAVAVLQVTKGQDGAAVQHFQRVLELVPEHPLALNNLATLLSERPNQLAEALDYIEQAIKISGRQPALLDTLGTIQIRLGEFESAVSSLEEAVALGGSDARYHFHLAVAYQKTGKIEDSRKSLRRARRGGLAKMVLTQGDQKLLKELEQLVDSART